MSIHVTADWHEISLGQFFRKTELYLMDWKGSNVDLDNYALVGASYGGPVAIIRDEKKFTRVTPSIPAKPIISIYSATGSLIHATKWDSGVLIKMGWSSSEDLICIQEDGNLLVYSLFGQLKDTIHCLSGSTPKQKAYEAEIFQSNHGTGIAYLTTKQNFIVINDHRIVKMRTFQGVPGEGPFSAWSVISGPGKETKVIAARDSSLYLLDVDQCTEVPLQFSSVADASESPPTVTGISVSLNGEHIALYTNTGILWLGSSDFGSKYCEIPMSIPIRPKQLIWCGKEAVLISWDSVPTLDLVDRQGQKLTFPMDSKFYMVPEIDSVRVISNGLHEIIQRVPEDTRLIFGIGSLAPGSWLLEAYKEFTNRTSKADEYIRCIPDIEEAVEQCISAAGYEFHPQNQKLLMKAAYFGKLWLTKYNPEAYLHMSQMLRVINATKHYKISIPLTFQQLEHMTIPVLLDRLLLRRHYALAFSIAETLRLPDFHGKSRILAHWACYKVTQMHIEDGKLAAEIHNKLKSDPGATYSEIAERAAELGRKRLALSLAHYEKRKGIQVGLFLTFGDTKTALEKAVESEDSDMIYDCLFRIREDMSLSAFQILVRSYPTAYTLYVNFCKISNPEAARRMFEMEDDFPSQAELFIEESSKEKRLEGRIASLHSAQQKYLKAEAASQVKEYRKGKYEFSANMCEERIKLLKQQQALEVQYGQPFLNLSLRETLKQLLGNKEIKAAEKMRVEFRVTDRVFWLMRITCLGEARDWIELEKLSKPKKIPGGFEDFVEVCLQFGSVDEALKYLPKVREDLQVKYYVEAGCYETAANIALAQKDEEMLGYIYHLCVTVDRDVASKVKAMQDSLAK